MKKVFYASVLATFILSICPSLVFSKNAYFENNIVVKKNKKQTAAIAFNVQYMVDLSEGWSIFNACAGPWEASDIESGTFHILIHGIISDNRISFNYQSNIQNLIVVAADGTRYVGNSINQVSRTSKFDGSSTYKYTSKIVLTTPGSNNNAVIFYDLYTTIDELGKVTVRVDNFRTACE